MLAGRSKTRLLLVPVVFIITMTTCSYSLLHKNQLEFMEGFAEEYYGIALHLLQTGTLGIDNNNPSTLVFRPPGYPIFIGSILGVWGKATHNYEAIQKNFSGYPNNVYTRSVRSIMFAQAFLLSLSSMVIYLWLSGYLSLGISFVMALLFGCNPYMIIIAGIIHYDILHIFVVILAAFSLVYVIDGYKDHSPGWVFIIPGILWGIATLVRPTTMILPVFILGLFIMIFNDRKRILRLTLIFSLGMLLSIAPYAIRNYHLTSELIPINAQSGIALWSGTAIKTDRNPNLYKWWTIWNNYGLPIYSSRVHNVDIFGGNDAEDYIAYSVQADRVFKEEALKNIKGNPTIYLHNIMSNFLTFNIDINSAMIRFFQEYQNKLIYFNITDYLNDKKSYDSYSSLAQIFFKYFIYLLQVISMLSIALLFVKAYAGYKDGALRKFLRDHAYLLVAITAYLTLCIAHSVTHMDFMYYYQKVPFLFLFSAYFLNVINQYRIVKAIGLGDIMSYGISCYSLALIYMIII